MVGPGETPAERIGVPDVRSPAPSVTDLLPVLPPAKEALSMGGGSHHAESAPSTFRAGVYIKEVANQLLGMSPDFTAQPSNLKTVKGPIFRKYE